MYQGAQLKAYKPGCCSPCAPKVCCPPPCCPSGTRGSQGLQGFTGPAGGEAFTDKVYLGTNAGASAQGSNAVAIGTGAGQNTQGTGSVAIGTGAGSSNQSPDSVAIGTGAGGSSQGLYSVAIGNLAGASFAGNDTVVIGNNMDAGDATSGTGSVLISSQGASLALSTAFPTAPCCVINWDRVPGTVPGATALVTRAGGRMYLGVLPLEPTGGQVAPATGTAGWAFMLYDTNSGEVATSVVEV